MTVLLACNCCADLHMGDLWVAGSQGRGSKLPKDAPSCQAEHANHDEGILASLCEGGSVFRVRV